MHALGTSSDGRDLVADGRARTFIPLVPPAGRATAHGAGLRRTPPAGPRPAGRRRKPERPRPLGDLTRPDGRLTRLADFGASAGSAPRHLAGRPRGARRARATSADGNPPLSLGPAQRAPARGDEDDRRRRLRPQPRAATRRRSPARSLTESRAPTAQDARTQRRASGRGRCWRRSSPRRAQDTVLTVGYADPDVAALARRRPSLLRRSDDLAARRMAAWGLDGTPAVAPRRRLLRPRPPRRDPPGLADAPQRPRTVADPGALQPPLRPAARAERRARGRRWPRAHPLPGTRSRCASGSSSEAALEATKGDEPPRPVVLDIPAALEPRAALARGRLLRRPGDLVAADRRRCPRATRSRRTTDELAYGSEQRAEELGRLERRRRPAP